MTASESSPAVFIDRFGAGLDELTRRDRRNPEIVLHTLRAARRFSVFEATEHQDLAHLLERLTRDGRIATKPLGFPWIAVTHIDGEALT